MTAECILCVTEDCDLSQLNQQLKQRFLSMPNFSEFTGNKHSFRIKRPAREACLYMGGNQSPTAPRFVFLITFVIVGRFFSNLAGVCSSRGEFF